ncbi:recombinase family protein [Trebonia kvetii]|uniref:Recombinase family protein n=1 Tax=Trebonia kvetii TaxID=2480626 RepID=A0A6P2BQU0_9ACTN|nr:recombinase family protein [Trebonia kvetii]TVY99127.1 recombinase family protein [Trebonia kvetii]
MTLARYRPQGQLQQKIRPEHLNRAAVVYVRQSSRQQVLDHSESTRLQYGLAERAVALGWARSQVVVIDDDLGVSAATPDSRKGFARLVTEVTMGRAGIVLGIEMSRLARTGRDWHQLLELCSLSGVLLADPDGVYDPGVYNDRLLLGLKGTMSEAELYLIRQRMLSGRLAKAERGELAVPLPIGYVRRPSGEAALDPDEQAQHVVRLVFGAFRRLGTLNGVLRYLVGQGVQLPVRVHSGPAKGELEWRRPTRETLQLMLHNPVYAGYYAYGRRQVEPRRKVAGRPSTGRVVMDSSEWLALLPGRLPAYITEEEYEANIGRMAANRQTAATPGAPRDGSALLSGLLRCGRCGGHRMTVRYHDGPGAARPAHGYTCAFYQANYGIGGNCQHIAGPSLDDWIAARVLEAVAPAALEVSMAAAAQAEDERAMLDKLWRQRLERARHAADRARRQYQLAEPENRLVARQLEADWEAALAETALLEADYQRFTEEQPATLTAAEREAIQALARDLPLVWNARSTTQADRKELLRIVIEDITATVVGNSELVDIAITWAGGHQTTGQTVRPVARLDQLSYYPALLARVTELAAAGRDNRQIADALNAEGLRPPKRTSRFNHGQVRTLITQRGIRRQPKGRPAALASLEPGQWSVPGLAAELRMPTATIYNWIYRGWITARHAPGTRNWIITADDEQMRQLRERRARPPGFYARARWASPAHEPDDTGEEP